MTTPRARRRQEIESDVLRLGRAQLAQVGAAALSVRAIARDLGLASSAVYRYVASRDELLTRLVVAAYTELADAVEAAVAGHDGPPGERLRTALRAYRAWAVAHPADFSLLYGSPVPGYDAPAERTTPPGIRVIGLLLGLLSETADSAPADGPDPDLPAPLHDELRAVADEFGADLDDAALIAGLALWTWLIGAVGQEVTGGFGDTTFADPAAIFDAQLDRQASAALRAARRPARPSPSPSPDSAR